MNRENKLPETMYYTYKMRRLGSVFTSRSFNCVVLLRIVRVTDRRRPQRPSVSAGARQHATKYEGLF